MSSTGAGPAGNGGQRQPEDHAGAAGPTPPGRRGNARPVRQFRMSAADRVNNAVFSTLARAGIGPAHLLTTRGRKTGRLRTTPVILVRQDQQRWLVAPYGAVSWVLNARAAGRVSLRRGHDSRDYTIRELLPEESGPVLQSYLRIAPGARPYFRAVRGAPVADFIAEAGRHPVFALTPVSEGER